MNWEKAQALIETTLSSQWVATPIAWRNIEPRNFSSPSQPLLPDGDIDYIDVMVEAVREDNITVNRSCARSQGQLTVSACVKEGTGVRTAKAYLDTIIEVYGSRTLTGTDGQVRFSPLISSASYSAQNGWYIEEATFMFYFERYRN